MPQPKRLYVYVLGPIDCWEGWSSHNEMASAANFAVAYWRPDDVKDRFWQAHDTALAAGWEGDGEPKLTVIPIRDYFCELVFAFKQKNNGSTFIVSPVEMPWLGKPCDNFEQKERI